MGVYDKKSKKLIKICELIRYLQYLRWYNRHKVQDIAVFGLSAGKQIQHLVILRKTLYLVQIQPGGGEKMILDSFKVKCLLAERGFGVVELAKRANCQHKTLKRGLDGLEITPQSVGKIARALDTSPAEIVTNEKSTELSD